MKLRSKSRCVISCFLVITILLATSCTDLRPVQNFGDIASDAARRFPVLARDLSASCRRQIYFQHIRENRFSPEKMQVMIDPSAANREAAAMFEPCKNFIEQEPRLIQANGVLLNYLQTMAALASDDTTALDRSLSNVANSFNETGLFEAAQVRAVKGIAGFIVKAAEGGYRKSKIKEAVEENNEHVKVLTEALSRIVTQQYQLQLNNERDELRNFYVTGMREFVSYQKSLPRTTPDAVNDPLPIMTIKRQWDVEDGELQKRLRAAAAYSEMMKEIQAAHQDLFDGRNKLTSREVLHKALAYGLTINNLAEDFRRAF